MTNAKLIPCPMCSGSGKIVPENLSIGQRIQIERKRVGITQAETATKLSIGRAQLANIEGDRSNPSIETLVKLAQVLGVKTDYLLGLS